MRADGSHQHNLTKSPSGGDYAPCFSPNGKRIAYNSNRDGDGEIFVIKPDGSHQDKLTDDFEPDWQPLR